MTTSYSSRLSCTNLAASAWTSWTRGSLKEVAVLLAKKRLLTSHTCASISHMTIFCTELCLQRPKAVASVTLGRRQRAAAASFRPPSGDLPPSRAKKAALGMRGGPAVPAIGRMGCGARCKSVLEHG
jgi:1,6-anhydro-N-acetylmuramate kinase